MVIASRVIRYQEGHDRHDIRITIFAPKQADKGWRCQYDIDWPDGARTFAGWGADAVQALLVTYQMIGAELYTSEYHQIGALIWLHENGGYGFPVPSNLRGILVGEDATSF